jgi:hypothetical protein
MRRLGHPDQLADARHRLPAAKLDAGSPQRVDDPFSLVAFSSHAQILRDPYPEYHLARIELWGKGRFPRPHRFERGIRFFVTAIVVEVR